MKHKKAQAALEYIATYGWAFLGVLVTLGALAYFGVFDMGLAHRSECQFAPGIVCHDYTIDDAVITASGKHAVTMELRNNFGVELEIVDVTGTANAQQISMPDCFNDAALTTAIAGVNWPSEGKVDIYCEIADTDYSTGTYYDTVITITAKQPSHTYEHELTGFVRAEGR